MKLNLSITVIDEDKPKNKIHFFESQFDKRLPLEKFFENMERGYSNSFEGGNVPFVITRFIKNNKNFLLHDVRSKKDVRPIGSFFKDGDKFTLVGIFLREY